ncbi:HD domain-containing protein [Candidatus Bipolaricaulota bacterium]|nr:HD domain-containing protein [Candidatus Bipolaricaulota bacterium]
MADLFATLIPAFRRDISASVALWIAAVVSLGASFGILIVVAATLVSELYLRVFISDLRGRNPLLVAEVISFNVTQVAFSLGLTAAYFLLVRAPVGRLAGGVDFIKVVGGFFIFVSLNSSLVSGVVSLSTKQPIRYLVVEWFRDFSAQYLILCVSAVLLVVLYSLSPWHMLLGLTPLVLVHLSFRSYLRIREEAQKTFEKVVELLEQRDPYTGEHSGEVAELAGAIAQELGLRGSEVEMIKAVARVHDIGKIAVPDRILLKPGKLDPDEWEVMKRHPDIGAELLKGLEVYGRYADIVRYEHEHWDGSGYPQGLKGEEIPLPARIIAAADVWHALISDRPYRPAYPKEKALDIIRSMAGRVLDPKVVGALLRVLERQG